VYEQLELERTPWCATLYLLLAPAPPVGEPPVPSPRQAVDLDLSILPLNITKSPKAHAVLILTGKRLH
jgi:hypothetical protein